MTKLLENIFRCVNIALVNELMLLCERMGIDIWEVIDAAKTKPFGFMPFYPGPGWAGTASRSTRSTCRGRRASSTCTPSSSSWPGKTNEACRTTWCERLMNALNDHRKALAGSRVLVLGVAYKNDIDDMRESPAIKIAELLHGQGGRRGLPRPLRSGSLSAARLRTGRADRREGLRRPMRCSHHRPQRCGLRTGRPLGSSSSSTRETR